MTYLRHLDMDDLIVMKMLLTVPKLKEISKTLGITPPALSHRLRKYKQHIPDFVVNTTKTGKWELSASARAFCEKASSAVAIFVIPETVAAVETVAVETMEDIKAN